MTLIELQEVLGQRIEMTLNKDLTPEERLVENAQSALVVGLAKQMIQNGDLILRTEKLSAQCKNLETSYAMTLVTGPKPTRDGRRKKTTS